MTKSESMNAAMFATPSVPLRSTNGCWTCRLRKKKCDEVRPGCERCGAANIDCHYGPKPGWIEDPTFGKAELDRLKTLVAASASRKRAAFRAKVRSDSFLAGASRPTVEQSADVSKNSNRSGTQNDQGGYSGGGSTYDAEEEEFALSSKWIDDHEANLMMHYLDHVFWVQFRFHTPSIASGGRGWLLSLLTRTKPLYHAALSLSAFHQQSLISLEQGGMETDYLQELERQHQLTLKELQLFIQARCLTPPPAEGEFDRNIQILACIVQLISFELFNGGESNWQVHLRAASDLVLVLHNIVSPYAPNSITDQPIAVSRSLSETSALNIFSACIVWIDNLSCISTGVRSHLGVYYDRLLLSPTCQNSANIDLHTVSGCHNWVMIIINEITDLSVDIEERKKANVCDLQRLGQRTQTLEIQLESGRQGVQSELDAMRRPYNGPPPHWMPVAYNDHTVLAVTNLYAAAAVIYLLAASSTNISSSQAQVPLINAIEAVRIVPDFRMFRELIWPLCVAGCMASSPSDREFFRRTATGAVKDSRSFGNSEKALEILEMSWKLQDQRGHLVDCASTLREMGTRVLLV